MRFIVTGGSGFIGTNIIESLLADNHQVLNIDIATPKKKDHLPFFKQLDILNFEDLNSVVRDFQPEIIYHMAARTDLNGFLPSDYAANTVGVENLIHTLNSCKSLKAVLFASSRLVCKIGYQPISESDYCPDTLYGESKVEGEKIVTALRAKIPCRWFIVRPTSIWGPWFDVPYKNFFLSIINGRYVHPNVNSIPKSFGYVKNSVFQMRKICEGFNTDLSETVFYMADYPPIDVISMANIIQQSASTKTIRSVPVFILRMIALVGDFFRFLGFNNPPLTTFRLNNLLTPMIYDLQPIKNAVGILPFNLKQGVEETIDWLKESGNIK